MRIKGWLITAGVLTVLGAILLGGSLTVAKWDFTRLSTVRYETNEHRVEEAFRHVRVETDTADVRFLPSADGETAVQCVEASKVTHTVTVKDDTLTVKVNDTRRWYEHIGIGFGTPRITVYLPAAAYDSLAVESDTGDIHVSSDFTWESVTLTGHTGDVTYDAPATGDVSIQTTTGAIEVQNVTVGRLSLAVSTGRVSVAGVACREDVTVKVSTGKVTLTDLTCRNLTSEGSTGDMFLENVIVGGTLTVERNTGDVLLTRSNAASLRIATTTGDVKGSLLSDKIFITSTDTGRVEVPKTTDGGRCEIVTDTGDIRITIVE
ncbi:MAG: DUF4097 domain-containing protein [Ruminococcaceae bacterium]|nr:DUF4097 domain-containing protein [Oscillospiraceae bacterium]